MTVGELIRELQKHPESLVVLRGCRFESYAAIRLVAVEDATEIKTGKKTKAIVID